MNKITRELQKKILTQIITPDLAEDGVLVDAKVVLYTERAGDAEAPLYADLTQPTFTGYAASAVLVYGTPFIDEEGAYHVSGDLKQFQCSGGTPDDEIAGAAVIFGTTPNEKVLWYEDFDDAVGIAAVGDGLRYAPNLRLGFDGDYGSGLLLS